MRHRNRAGGVWRVCRGPKEEPSREPASEGMRRLSFGAETTVSFQLLTPKVWTHAKHQFPLLTDLTEVFGCNSRESPNWVAAPFGTCHLNIWYRRYDTNGTDGQRKTVPDLANIGTDGSACGTSGRRGGTNGSENGTKGGCRRYHR
jgi:hypothetical protein